MPETLEAPSIESFTDSDTTPLVSVGDAWKQIRAERSARENGTTEEKPTEISKSSAKKPETKAAPVESIDPLDALLGDTKPADAKLDETKAEPDEFKDVETGIKDDKVRQNFVNIRKANDGLKKQLAEATRKLSETATGKPSEIDPAITERLATYEKENAELRDAVTALNVEYDPKFRSEFVEGRQKLLDKALKRVADGGGDADGFTTALRLDGRKRIEALREALENVDEMERPRVISLIDQIQELDERRAEVTKDPQQAYERLQRERSEQSQKQFQESERIKNTEFDKVVQALPEKFFMLRKMDENAKGAAEWNKEVDASISEARKLFNPDTPFESLVEAAAKSRRADKLQTMFMEERTKRIAADRKIAEFEGAGPTMNGGRQPSAGEGDKLKSPGAQWKELQEQRARGER